MEDDPDDLDGWCLLLLDRYIEFESESEDESEGEDEYRAFFFPLEFLSSFLLWCCSSLCCLHRRSAFWFSRSRSVWVNFIPPRSSMTGLVLPFKLAACCRAVAVGLSSVISGLPSGRCPEG